MKITKLLLISVPVALLVSCNLNSSDEGATKVSNYEKLPNCSTKESISGKSPVGEKVYIEEEESTYLCTDSGWVLSSVKDMEGLPACPTKRGTNLGMKIYVESDSIYYLCVKSGWAESDSSEGDDEIPVPELENGLVKGFANAIGPFVEGGRVELREALIKTGDTLVVSDSVLAGSVSGKAGYFTIPGVTTYSSYGVVTVKGLFKDALTGEVSGDSLELTAFVDLNDELKVDVFAALQFGRIKTLLAKGYEPRAAMDLSEKEIAAAFGVKENDDMSTARLAIALMLRSNVDEADFVDRIASLAEDFAEDGVWDDDAARTSLADFAFNIENLKLKDEDTEEVLLKLNDYRKNLEAFGMDDVPGYEAFYNKFWVDAYGLGICGNGRQDVVMINQNEQSDSASAYFTCNSLSWVVSTDYERDTVGLGNAPDGTLEKGNVDKDKTYAYDTTGFGQGTPRRWKEADSIVLVIGKSCTAMDSVKNTVVVTEDEDENKIYYGCVDRTWSKTDSVAYKIGYMCSEESFGVYESYVKTGSEKGYAKCDSTYGWSWSNVKELDYDLRDEECDPEVLLVVKSKGSYVCEDAEKHTFREAKKEEDDIGSPCNVKTLGKTGKIGEDNYTCGCFAYDETLPPPGTYISTDPESCTYPAWTKQ